MSRFDKPDNLIPEKYRRMDAEKRLREAIENEVAKGTRDDEIIAHYDITTDQFDKIKADYQERKAAEQKQHDDFMKGWNSVPTRF